MIFRITMPSRWIEVAKVADYLEAENYNIIGTGTFLPLNRYFDIETDAQDATRIALILGVKVREKVDVDIEKTGREGSRLVFLDDYISPCNIFSYPSKRRTQKPGEIWFSANFTESRFQIEDL